MEPVGGGGRRLDKERSIIYAERAIESDPSQTAEVHSLAGRRSMASPTASVAFSHLSSPKLFSMTPRGWCGAAHGARFPASVEEMWLREEAEVEGGRRWVGRWTTGAEGGEERARVVGKAEGAAGEIDRRGGEAREGEEDGVVGEDGEEEKRGGVDGEERMRGGAPDLKRGVAAAGGDSEREGRQRLAKWREACSRA